MLEIRCGINTGEIEQFSHVIRQSKSVYNNNVLTESIKKAFKPTVHLE